MSNTYVGDVGERCGTHNPRFYPFPLHLYSDNEGHNGGRRRNSTCIQSTKHNIRRNTKLEGNGKLTIFSIS